MNDCAGDGVAGIFILLFFHCYDAENRRGVTLMDGSTGSALSVRLITHFPHDIDIAEFRAGDLTYQRDTICVIIRSVNENSGFLSI